MSEKIVISKNVPLPAIQGIYKALLASTEQEGGSYPGHWITLIESDYTPVFRAGISAMLSSMRTEHTSALMRSDGYSPDDLLAQDPLELLRKLAEPPPFSMMASGATDYQGNDWIYMCPMSRAAISDEGISPADMTDLANDYHAKTILEVNRRLGILASPYKLEELPTHTIRI